MQPADSKRVPLSVPAWLWKLGVGVLVAAALILSTVWIAPIITNQITLFRAEAHDEDYEWHEAAPLYKEVAQYYWARRDMARWADALGNAARCYADIGQIGEVVDQFDALTDYWESKGAPETAQSYYLDGGAYWKQEGEHVRAIRSFRRAASYYAAVEEGLNEGKVRVEIAQSLVALGHPLRARATYLAALEAAGERGRPVWARELSELYGPSEQEERAAALSTGGRLALAQAGGQTSEAVVYFEDALAAYPRETDYKILTQIYLSTNQDDAASQLLTRFLSDYPSSAFANHANGMLLWAGNHPYSSLEYLERAARLDATYQPSFEAVLHFIDLDRDHKRALAALDELNRQRLGRLLWFALTTVAAGVVFRWLRVPRGIANAMTFLDALKLANDEVARLEGERAVRLAEARAELRLMTIPQNLRVETQLQALLDHSSTALGDVAAAPLTILPAR